MQENPNNQPYYEEEDEIDIMELISKLWKSRSMIIKWCIAGAIIGLVVGFSIPKTYTASVTLAPEMQQKTNSSVSSIASMMGVNLNNSVDAISVEMFPDVVHSTPFIFELFDLPVTFEHKDTVVNTTLIDYMLEYQKCPWWTPIIQFPFKALGWCIDLVTPDDEDEIVSGTLDPNNLPKKEREVVKFFKENIIVNVDKKNFKTQMSIDMQDPVIAANVMEAVAKNLTDYMSEYRTSKARQDVNNLEVICEQRKVDYYKAQHAYANYIDSNKNVSLQSAQVERDRLQQEMNLAYQVYSQVATNLEAARIQEQQAKPVFAIIQPPVIPLERTAPSRSIILIICTFLVGLSAALWALLRDDIINKIRVLFKT